MIDHVFLGAVSGLARALDEAFLVRLAYDDRLATDLVAGDVVWETSVSLPGDGNPPRVRADVSLDWPTWSQSAWRSWALDEPVDDQPEIGVEVVLRLQRLSARPPVAEVLARLEGGEPAGVESFERVGVILEEDVESREVAVEVAFEGVYRLSDPEDAPRRALFGLGPAAGTGGRGPDVADGGRGPDVADGGRGAPAGEARTGPADGPAGEAAARGPAGAGDAPVRGPAGEAPARGAPGEAPVWGPAGEAARVAGGEAAPGGGSVGARLEALSRWVASALVGLAELDVEFLPPDED